MVIDKQKDQILFFQAAMIRKARAEAFCDFLHHKMFYQKKSFK